MVNQQKLNARIKQCVKLGMSYDYMGDCYKRDQPTMVIYMDDIREYTDENWNTLISKLQTGEKEIH